MKKIFLFTYLLLSATMFSQADGYWDVNAIKRQVIPLNAEQSKTIQIILPQGTSKFSYKIKVISPLGDVIYDFADVFKNSSDPRFVIASYMTKAVVSLKAPKISYAIENVSNQRSLCDSNNGVEEVVSCIDFQNKKCIDTDENLNILNFYFKSENKMWSLKIVFEYVSFVDYELQRGWSKNLKNDFYNYLISSMKQGNMNATDREIENLVNCMLTNIIKDYTFEGLKSLAEFEKRNYLQKLLPLCGVK